MAARREPREWALLDYPLSPNQELAVICDIVAQVVLLILGRLNVIVQHLQGTSTSSSQRALGNRWSKLKFEPINAYVHGACAQ